MAQAIDAFRREGVGHQYEGMEILLCRLMGLQKADLLQNDHLLLSFAWAPPEDPVPQEKLRAALKDAERRKRLQPKSSPWGRPTGGSSKSNGSNSTPADRRGDAKSRKNGSGSAGRG